MPSLQKTHDDQRRPRAAQTERCGRRAPLIRIG
jgi:hypothetical protein